MSRERPKPAPRKPGGIRLITDRDVEQLSERVGAPERHRDGVVASPAAIPSITAAASPAPSTDSPDIVPPSEVGVEPAQSDTSRLDRPETAAADQRTDADPRYPRGRGSREVPYLRTDGKALRSTHVYLPEDVHRQLRVYCGDRDISQSQAVAEALELLFKRDRAGL